MDTKQAVSKTQAVRDYLNAHPGANPSEITTALNKQGIEVTSGYVAAIKTDTGKKAAAETAVPPAVEKPADTLSLDQIKNIAQAIKRIRSRWSKSGLRR